MCGICGKLVWQNNEPVSQSIIKAMSDTLAHRGPDGEGHYFKTVDDVSIGLGHRRLSIIDLSEAGSQPMCDESGELWVVHNGEVYNFLSLRPELEALGLSFRSNTDTEVVLNAYRAWGPACIDRLEGMFAFAIWDEPRQRLFIARDRVGIKPLYYSLDNGTLRFASELKALLVDPSLDRRIDADALDRYFSYGYVPAPDTVFESVKKLPPAHTLVWEDGNTTIAPYWRYEAVSAPASFKSEGEWLDAFAEVLERVVAKQMVSDVPLGAFLSGGIDSSLIVWMASQASSQSIKSFTVGFGESEWTEAPYARRVAEQFGTEHHEYVVTPDTLDILPNLVWHLDEPFGDSSVLPTYHVSRMTRQDVTVALSGDGGDELFAGYTRYQGERLSRVFRRFPKWMRSSVVQALRQKPLSGKPSMRRLGDVLANAELDFVDRYRNKQSIVAPALKTGLYSDDFRNTIGPDTDIALLTEIVEAADGQDFIDRLTMLDMEFYLPNDMLTKVDRMSMAVSLEVRVPFLDEEVIDIARRIPTSLKLKHMTTKYLLRRLTARALPADIWKRGKQGFGIPIQSWFRGNLVGYARDVLLDHATIDRGYFNRAALDAMLAEHEANRADHGHLIYSLIVFETWCRVFLDGSGA